MSAPVSFIECVSKEHTNVSKEFYILIDDVICTTKGECDWAYIVYLFMFISCEELYTGTNESRKCFHVINVSALLKVI